MLDCKVKHSTPKIDDTKFDQIQETNRNCGMYYNYVWTNFHETEIGLQRGLAKVIHY